MIFEFISSALKYIFITIIYIFIFGIMRLIYLDIKSMNLYGDASKKHIPYLKLINRREKLGFKVLESYGLDKDVSIGRGRKNNIIINDIFLSSEHVRIFNDDGKYYIEDLNSTNGTYLNNRPVKKEIMLLQNGDRVRIGRIDFLFVKD